MQIANTSFKFYTNRSISYRLEVKLSALGEKKSDLQVQLQQNARTLANLRSTLCEEEKKRNEARQYAAKLEALVNKFEQQNFEMEEKEMETRYQLHTLEKVVPAMVIYYMWRLLNIVTPLTSKRETLTTHKSMSDSSLVVMAPLSRTQKTIFKSKHAILNIEDPTDVFLDGAEQFLPHKNDGDAKNYTSLPSDSAFLIVEELSDKCHHLEERVIELELKEKLYQETLQNGDELFNKKENEYQRMLKSLEDELKQKSTDLERAESQLRKYSSVLVQESHFQDRISQLETKVLNLQEILSQRDKEKKMLEGEKESLNAELDESLRKVEIFKETIEKPLNVAVDSLKQKLKDLFGDLDRLEQDKNEEEELHRKMVSCVYLIADFTFLT